MLRCRLSLPSCLVLATVSLAGCASVRSPQRSPGQTSARAESGQRDSIDRAPAPRISLRMPSGGFAGGQYVEAAFRVADDAYALVVAVDRDLRVHVIYPESPTDAGFVQRSHEFRSERIFAGFGQPWTGDMRLRFLRGGVVLAVASARPLQYERLTDANGDWDEVAIAELLDRGGTSNATSALARKVTLTGQTYSTDFSSFSGSRFESLATAFDSYAGYPSSCGVSSYFGFGGGSYESRNGRDQLFATYGYSGYGHSIQYEQRGNQLYKVVELTGRCGELIYTQVTPVPPMLPSVPGVPRDTTTRDSTMRPASTDRRSLSPAATTEIRVRSASATEDGGGDATTLNASGRRGLGARRLLVDDDGAPRVMGGLRFRPSVEEPREPTNARGAFRTRDASGTDPEGSRHGGRDDGMARDEAWRARIEAASRQQTSRQETPDRAEPRPVVERQEPRQEPRQEAPHREPPQRSEPTSAPTPIRPAP